MKKGYWWILVGVVLVSLPVVYYYWSIKQPAEKVAFKLLQEIPGNARVVLLADAGKIGTILGKELFYHPQRVLEIKERLATEEEYDEIFDGLGDAGIKYQDKLVMYITGKDTTDLAIITLLGIKDRLQFRNFFHTRMPEKIPYPMDSIEFEEADAHFVDSLNLMFAWNDHFLSATRFVKAPSEERKMKVLEDLFLSEEKMGDDSLYMEFIKEDHQVGLWLQTEEAFDPGFVQLKHSPFKSLGLDVKFENEKCVLKGHYHLKDSTSIDMLPFRMGMKGRIPKDSSRLFMQMALEPTDYKLNKNDSLWAAIDSVLMKNGLSVDEIKSAWNGYADVEVKGIKKRINEFVHIGFDDNFNEVREVTTKEVLYPDFISAIGVTGSGEDLIRKLEAKKIITRSSDNTFDVIDMFGFPVMLTLHDDYWIISTMKDVTWVTDTAETPVFRFDLDYQQCQYDTNNIIGKHSWTDHFIRANKNMDHIRLAILPSDNGLEFSGEISFIGDNTNGLIEMLDIVMSMKARLEAGSGKPVSE